MSLSVWVRIRLPLAIFVAGAVLSIALAVSARQEIGRSAQARFDATALDLARKVEARFDDYIAVLIGLRARFNTSETVARSDFTDYVAGLNLASAYPGFQAVNYAPRVLAGDKQAFEQRVRGDADLTASVASSFAIKPPGEREIYYPLVYIEPRAGNERLLGNDLGAMPDRGDALEQGRDTGGLVMSGRKVRIAGRESDIGLAMRLPVYRPRQPLDTLEQRRNAYLGSVGAGFSVAGMLGDVVGATAARTFRLRLIDAGPGQGAIGTRAETRFVTPASFGEQQLLFDSAASAKPAAAPVRSLERMLGFELGGHSWLVEIGQDENQVFGPLDKAIPWFIVFGGLATSMLLAGIVFSLTTSRSRAQVLANKMTVHLRTSERQLEEAQHLASLGSWILDPKTGALQCSEEARRILGFETGSLRSDLPALLLRVPDGDRAAVEQQIAWVSESKERSEFEHRLCLPDGTERWLHVIAQSAEEDGKTLVRGTVRDATRPRKDALRQKLEYKIARLLAADGRAEMVITQALEAVCTDLRWDCGALWSVGEDGAVRCAAAWHADHAPQALRQFVSDSRSLEYGADEGSLGRAWKTTGIVQIDTLAAPHDFARDVLAGQSGLTFGVVVPIVITGSTTALELFGSNTYAVDAETLESLRVIALQIAQYKQRKLAERSLRFMASHDELTGLFNRAALQHELDRAIKRSNRHQKQFAVLFIDLDRFKHINDTLGHGVGDEMIKICGERLTALLREADVVARFGGDEFVLLLENLSSANDAAVLSEKVLACCAEPFAVAGRELHVTASVGVSVYPDDGGDAEALLKNADTAMYRAKEKGRNTFRFYAAKMNAQSTEQLMLESALRRALERGELEMHYQPKMDLQTQRIVGVEALMRWHHPVLGMVPPVKFIPIAEEIGLIVSLGKWSLERACADSRSWQEFGLPEVLMSVNLSPRQFESRTLIADIQAILEASGLKPSLLELEITEGAVMANPERATQLLQTIRDMGVGLAIDDFGTGYSSLSYLKHFPLSTVKIDRSFINDLSQDADARALIDGIITLAHGLRMKVVAEGVETPAQFDYLHSRGCDEAQGYWLCKPVSADEVRNFMARHLRNQFAPTVAA
ncbi:diguanylate cyclase (GGDEF)-like protein/PAS domain S-box-containing protein [Variovorax paradoxus]|uniref:bifunctional diguanylate cyclase/phosphodiesterase n=1 Tax=Variovorax paradoxus TaxID=34073 RepID=UPI00278CF562|nr:EAL domain-containing protein [Variovorax paradoxus]MDQ0569233.1 diguanylate cyclase (GGDEF)-like protein/PAS domain S-box-containing protein [Variovorax paradoxus]